MIEDVIDLIRHELKAAGADLKLGGVALRDVLRDEALTLSYLVDDDDFAAAVAATKDIIKMEIGLALVGQADAFDERLVGIAQGALVIAARALKAGMIV